MKKFRIRIKGANKAIFHDTYYWVLKSSWLNFLFIAIIAYLLINSFFASLYYFFNAGILNTNPTSYWDAYVFSFQASSTLGFGHYLPQSNLAHTIVIFDTISGIFYAAIITGLAFAKFARPMAKVQFTNNAILTEFDGIPTLMFRMVNSRETNIIDVNLNVSALIPYTSTEGIKMRRFYKLPLVSDHNPTFALSWTVMHQINEASPLFGMNLEEIQEKSIFLFISLTGIDDVLSQSVHASHQYRSKSIVKANKFVDILDTDTKNKYTLDYNKFHLYE
jgi:inward rectifier potassium channel